MHRWRPREVAHVCVCVFVCWGSSCLTTVMEPCSQAAVNEFSAPSTLAWVQTHTDAGNLHTALISLCSSTNSARALLPVSHGYQYQLLLGGCGSGRGQSSDWTAPVCPIHHWDKHSIPPSVLLLALHSLKWIVSFFHLPESKPDPPWFLLFGVRGFAPSPVLQCLFCGRATGIGPTCQQALFALIG